MNLYKFLESKISIHSYTNYFSTKCPFHQDQNPSMLVSEEGFYCLACGAKGKLKVLYNKVFDIEQDYIDRDKSTGKVYFPVEEWHSLHETLINTWFGMNYLQSRGLTESIIMRLMIGYSKPKGYYSIPIFHCEIQSPQPTYGVIFRASPAHQKRLGWKYWTISNADLYFPVKLSTHADKLFITFGIFDAIILMKLGLVSASTIWGKRMREETLRYLSDLQIPIYIIPDANEEAEAHNLARKLGWRGSVIELNYPFGTKDVNEYYLKNPSMLKLELQKYAGKIIEEDLWD